MQKQMNETVAEVPLVFGAESEAVEPFPRSQANGSDNQRNVPRGKQAPGGVFVGTIVGLLNSCEALIDYGDNDSGAPIKARTVVLLTEKEIGHQVVLGIENGDQFHPVVLGVIRSRETASKHITVEGDGDKFVVIADREIELRCGEASITLTRAGKVLIKGEYVLSRSKGLNRIKGAAVSIN